MNKKKVLTLTEKDIWNICKKCGARCCKFGGVIYTKKEKERVLKAGFKDYFGSYHEFYGTRSKNGNCPYLKGYACSIHKVRPTFCRIWPVFPKIVNGKKEYFICSCPLAPYLTKEDIKKAIKLANKLPNKIYELSWKADLHQNIFDVFKPIKLNLKNLK